MIDASNNLPTDGMMTRIATAPYRKDGSPNPDFGKTEPWWMQRHEQYLRQGKEGANLVFLGDSITDGWTKAKPLWDERFGRYKPLNLGIGGDRTQNVLWRIAHGELDDVRPKVVVLMIGTNNIGRSEAEIVTGVTAVVRAIQAKLPSTHILLLGIFPRSELPISFLRKRLTLVNQQLAKLDDGPEGRVHYFELWNQFLDANGKLSKDIMPDGLHPNVNGYTIWADAMGPVLAGMMDEK